LKEGRGALATSFQCFKYMALYSMIQTISVVYLYSRSTNLADQAFLFIDLFLVLPLSITMNYTRANDCPALKVANVGISLSEAEASLAAPFMSKVVDISAVEVLLKEGRGALATSFQCFKYMALYSMIQTISVVYLYSRSTNLADQAFLFIDLFLVLPLSITMNYTRANDKLSKRQPSDSLLSKAVLVSVLGQVFIQAAFQVLTGRILMNKSWYMTPKELNDNTEDLKDLTSSYDSSTIFMVSTFQYLITVLTFSEGKPFRQRFYTNNKFLINCILSLTACLVLVFWTNPKFMDIFNEPQKTSEHDMLKMNMRYLIVAIAAVNLVVSLFFEKVLVNKLFARPKENPPL